MLLVDLARIWHVTGPTCSAAWSVLTTYMPSGGSAVAGGRCRRPTSPCKSARVGLVRCRCCTLLLHSPPNAPARRLASSAPRCELVAARSVKVTRAGRPRRRPGHQCMCKLPVRFPCLIRHGGSVLRCCRGEEASRRHRPIERGPGTRTTGSGGPRSHLSRSNRRTAPRGRHRAARATPEGDIRPRHPEKKGTARVTSILRSTIRKGLTGGRWGRQP
jgi:hypothetical protein